MEDHSSLHPFLKILTDNREYVGGDAGVERGRVRRHLAGEIPGQVEAHVPQGDVRRVRDRHLEEEEEEEG